MSLHFHPIAVKEVRTETPDCVSVVFDIPESLKEEFAFKAGQNLAIKAIINGKEVRRSYSLCTAPFENTWKVAIKKVEGGLFSVYANETLKEGDVLEVMPPAGNFMVTLYPEKKRNYVAIVAGSGITPVLSLVKTILKTEPQSFVTLVFGNKNRNSVMFFEELEAIKNKYLERFSLIHVFSREKTEAELNHGRITKEKLNELSSLVSFASADEFFLCGPKQMIFTTKDFLESAGIDKKKIHFELFSSQESNDTTPLSKEEFSSPGSNITVTVDGRSFSFDIAAGDSTTILDAALKQGADLPYACKGGMCCTCKAKLLEGKVKMDVHWGLEDDEVERGYILTCQSHPVTEKVVVDFDIK